MKINIKKSELNSLIKECVTEVQKEERTKLKLDEMTEFISHRILNEAKKETKKDKEEEKTKEAQELDDVEKGTHEHYTYNQKLFALYKKLRAPSGELGLSVSIALRLLTILEYMVDKISRRGNLTQQQIKMVEKAVDSRLGGK